MSLDYCPADYGERCTSRRVSNTPNADLTVEVCLSTCLISRAVRSLICYFVVTQILVDACKASIQDGSFTFVVSFRNDQ